MDSAKVLADGAGLGVGGVGGAHQLAVFEDRAVALEHLHHDRRGDHVIRPARHREWAGFMHDVKLLGLRAT